MRKITPALISNAIAVMTAMDISVSISRWQSGETMLPNHAEPLHDLTRIAVASGFEERA